MAEPWLDGLSEEWDSQPGSSSPSINGAGSRSTSRRVSSIALPSRIPHLAHNIRNASVNHNNFGASTNSGTGSFLKPRSSRGIAKLRESNNALTERSASSLNANANGVPSTPPSASKRRVSSSTIPLPSQRRASSALSLADSGGSVQHYTINKDTRIEDTPEWKRRLVQGEQIDSDGLDLFSPSKLEGMFKQSSAPIEPPTDETYQNDENDDSVIASGKKPWNSLGMGADSGTFPAPSSDNYGSHRMSTARSRLPGMGTLQAVNEDEEENDKSFDMSAISSDVVRQGNIRGIVRRRVSDLEEPRPANKSLGSWKAGQDPRMRTISGRKEISDEVFSDIEDAERSSLRRQALQETLDTDPVELRQKLRDTKTQSTARSRSRSSDHDVSYDAEGLGAKDDSMMPEDGLAEITSLSLPEDLSMGTQQYNHDSILVTRRQPSTRQVSVIHRKPSYGANTSQIAGPKDFRSSPPPYAHRHNNIEDSRLSQSEPSSPADTSVVHHAPTSTQHSTAGSPLKLFGNRDTYTNNKLMRVLSQFEEDESDLQVPDEVEAFRMSNFGKGELDGFGFDKQIDRPVVEEKQPDDVGEKVFKEVASMKTSGELPKGAAQEPSPVKERSPKRRRTLLKDELFVDGAEVEIRISQIPGNNLAGQKRRDALPGKDAEQASPDTLKSRPIRRPSGSRKSSKEGHSRAASASEALQSAAGVEPQIAQQLAAELEFFANNAAVIKQDSRKPSLATKDYMAEANKVMEFIRARGKPKPALPEIREPDDLSELNPDAILDLDLDDSTKDSFSRPPSREGRIRTPPVQRQSQHDARTASHLRRFHEPEDLELLTSTSALGTWPLADNKAVDEAALVPVPEEELAEVADMSMQSDPPGMRILNDNDRKRKLSATDTDGQFNSDGSRRTINTSSSTGSGQRGMISQGTVSIPDTIGVMTFDHEKKIWVKQHIKRPELPVHRPPVLASPESRIGRQEVSEADPFDDIPDLSVDELKEQGWKKCPPPGARKEQSEVKEHAPPKIATPTKSSMKSPRRQRPSEHEDRPLSKGSEASKHEERLHNGVPSRDVEKQDAHQPRVVTIAFSSPVASEIPYMPPPSISDADLDEDDPSLLPLDDDGFVLASSPAKSTEQYDMPAQDEDTARSRPFMGSLERHEQYRAMTLNRRPVSRIDEYDEEQEDNQELSLVHIKHSELTPLQGRQLSIRKGSDKKESSILCLTPLSEFTLHQVDKLNHPEESFVAERVNSKALRQAHGSAALVEDALVKAITDAEPSELFWEQLRRLSLPNSGLAAVHGLKDYCSTLEFLDLTGNKITQLNDAPVSLRYLNISTNLVTDLTSWTHLHNLQTINVSANQLESLECFSGLIHLRHLNASNNNIRSIDGVLDLNGLISLDLSGNDVPEVDFHSSEFTSLKSLDLSKNNLMHVRNLDCLPALKRADLSGNLLEHLTIRQDAVAHNLETLNIAKNELHELDLTAFPALRTLDVDSNNLTVLHGLSEATSLVTLSARDQRVPSSLVNTILSTPTDIIALHLSANALPETGLALPTTPNYTLRTFELASCGLRSLPVTFGDHFPNLRTLNLNFNAISDLAPLQGANKLKELHLARNRIKKMRRTCLVLSRLKALEDIDLRDNPLTVGFYTHAPADKCQVVATQQSEIHRHEDVYQLPRRDAEVDKKWLGLLDETTWLRRRAMELLLVECCPGVGELDGLVFDREGVLGEKKVWERLMGKGVLRERGQTGREQSSVVGRGDEVLATPALTR